MNRHIILHIVFDSHNGDDTPQDGLEAQCPVHREQWAQTSSQSSQSHVAQSAHTITLAVIYHSLSCFLMATSVKHVNSQVP